jgi:acyl-CoA thioester hydrolase
VTSPFRVRFRVRYAECDSQHIVFNARWGDYVDLAVTELARAALGGVDPAVTGLDWRVVRQLIEWKAPARYDDILEAAIATTAVGTTSFTLRTTFSRGELVLVTAETVCVAVDRSGVKRAIGPHHRRALEAGAPGIVVDLAG